MLLTSNRRITLAKNNQLYFIECWRTPVKGVLPTKNRKEIRHFLPIAKARGFRGGILMIIITDASFKAPHSGTLSIFVGDIAKKKHVKAKSSVHAELLSIKMALDYLVAKNIKGATIINDNKPVVDHLNGKVKMCDQLIKIADQTKALMEQTETKIEWRSRKETVIPDMVCQGKAKNTKFKTLSLPQLDLLSPTMESTVIKLGEEVGELNRCVGKWRGMSGEKTKKSESAVLREIAKELLDVAQTCITMMFVLEEKHNVSIDSVLKEHYNKLRQKGYMS